jgi:hypothetical protein
VLLPSDTHRKTITPITAVVLPFVIYLLTLTRVQLEYLVATVQGQLGSGRAGPFVKVEGCCDWSFVCFQCEQMSQVQLEAFFLVQNACTAFPSTLISMLELSPPLSILLLLRVAGLSLLNIIILLINEGFKVLTAVVRKRSNFCATPACNSLNVNQRFGSIYHIASIFSLQGKAKHKTKVKRLLFLSASS